MRPHRVSTRLGGERRYPLSPCCAIWERPFREPGFMPRWAWPLPRLSIKGLDSRTASPPRLHPLLVAGPGAADKHGELGPGAVEKPGTSPARRAGCESCELAVMGCTAGSPGWLSPPGTPAAFMRRLG